MLIATAVQHKFVNRFKQDCDQSGLWRPEAQVPIGSYGILFIIWGRLSESITVNAELRSFGGLWAG